MGMMAGWSSPAAVRASRRNRSMAPSPKVSAGGSTLMATRHRSCVSVAKYTTPMPPRASSRSISYSPAVSSRRTRVNFATPASSSDAGDEEDGLRTSAPQLVQNWLPSGSGLAQWAQSMGGYDTAQGTVVPASEDGRSTAGSESAPSIARLMVRDRSCHSTDGRSGRWRDPAPSRVSLGAVGSEGQLSEAGSVPIDKVEI